MTPWGHAAPLGPVDEGEFCLPWQICLDENVRNTISDLLLPSLAILVSSVIAVVALRRQLLAQQRDRRATLVGRTIEMLAEVEAEGHLRMEGKPHQLGSAVIRAEAALSSLQFSLRGPDRDVPAVIRDEMFDSYLIVEDPQSFVAALQRTRIIYEDWTRGHLDRKYIREIGRWSGLSVGAKHRGLHQVKDRLEGIHRTQAYSRASRRTLIELLQRVPNFRRLERLCRPVPLPWGERVLIVWFEWQRQRLMKGQRGRRNAPPK